jgi:hypothetical protein
MTRYGHPRRTSSADERIEEVLKKTSRQVHEAKSPKVFANNLMRTIGKAFGLEYAILRGRLPGESKIGVIATFGLREDVASQVEVDITNKLALYLRTTGHFHYSSDLASDPHYDQKEYVEHRAQDSEGVHVVLRSAVFTPLFTKTWGFQGFLACFRSRKADFTAREIRAIHEQLRPMIATMGSVGLHRKPPLWKMGEQRDYLSDRVGRFFKALADDTSGEILPENDPVRNLAPSIPADDTGEASPLLLRRLVVRDFRCFRDLTVDFHTQPDQPLLQRVSLILGNNGSGKTSLLRSIALGMSSVTEATALVRGISQDLVIRHGARHAQIEAYLGPRADPAIRTEAGSASAIITTIEPDASGAVSVSQITEPPVFAWQRRFVCGYGANRKVFGDESLGRYEVATAVGSLFSYAARLQNPELILRRLSERTGGRQRILRAFEKVLTLGEGSVRLYRNGLRVSGNGGSEALSDVGDGFAGTLAWLSDMVAQAMLYNHGPVDPNKLEGVLLLDEIEQHLHPRWQYQITQLIAQVFPKLQIIATTHSPLCVIGLEDIPEPAEGQLLLLDPDEGAMSVRQGLEPPYAQRVDQILTSKLFGLPWVRSRSVDSDIQRLAELAGNPDRSADENVEMDRLRASLDQAIGTPETILQELAEAAADAALDWLIHERFARRAEKALQPEYYLTNREALQLAIRHHLNECKEME